MFPAQRQQNAVTAFIVSLGEVFRRFMWNFFRMENEHMSNAKLLIASKHVPLPFSLPELQLEEKGVAESDSSLLDYSRMDHGMPIRERRRTGYDCWGV